MLLEPTSAASASSWFPVLTLLIGWATGFVADAQRDRRALRRERNAKRIEFQRTTLLELQEASLKLIRAVRADYDGVNQPTEVRYDLDTKKFDALLAVRVQCARVSDARLRGLIDEFLEHAERTQAEAVTQAFPADQKRVRDMAQAFDKVQEGIGDVLRLLDVI